MSQKMPTLKMFTCLSPCASVFLEEFRRNTIIFITGNNANDVKHKINTMINALINWCEMNRLIINKEKTVAIYFPQPQKVQVENPQIKMHDTVINYTEHIKFLGLWLDKNIKWSIHTQQLIN
jgi:hypothetical protein